MEGPPTQAQTERGNLRSKPVFFALRLRAALAFPGVRMALLIAVMFSEPDKSGSAEALHRLISQ
jgi:hypothetical protein